MKKRDENGRLPGSRAQDDKTLSDSKDSLKIDNTTKVNLGIWGGRRRTVGIKMDEDLYRAFKPVAQAYFGSVCCAVEGFMAGILGALKYSEVNFGNSVTINDLHVHRNLKERRRLDPDLLTLEPRASVCIEEVAKFFIRRYDQTAALPSYGVILNHVRDNNPEVIMGEIRIEIAKAVKVRLEDYSGKIGGVAL